MKNSLLGFTLLCILFAGACKKDPVSHPGTANKQEIIFWAQCGECIPFTARFTLTPQQLVDKDGKVLPDSLFQFARQLDDQFPGELCASNKSNYGCATCYDGVSVFLQTDCDGVVRSWEFDPSDPANSDAIKAYATLIRQVYFKCAQ